MMSQLEINKFISYHSEESSISDTNANRLILSMELIFTDCENHGTNTFCGRNTEFGIFSVRGKYSYHWAVNG